MKILHGASWIDGQHRHLAIAWCKKKKKKQNRRRNAATYSRSSQSRNLFGSGVAEPLRTEFLYPLLIFLGEISDLNCYQRKQFSQPNFHWFHRPCGWLYGKMSTRTNQDDIFAVARQLEMRSQKHVRFWRRAGAQWFQRTKNRQK